MIGWSYSIHPSLRPQAPASFYLGHVSDCVPDSVSFGNCCGPVKRQTITEGHQNQALPELRNAVTPSFDDAFFDRVSEFFKLLNNTAENEHLLVEGHVGNILHEHRSRHGQANDLEERSPEITALVVRVAHAVAHTMPDFRAASLRERLAGRSTSDQIDTTLAHQAADFLDAIRLGEIPVHRQAWEVMTVCFKCFCVVISPDNHVEAGIMQTQAEATCATKQVSCEQGVRSLGALRADQF